MRAKASRLADKLMFAIWVTTIMSQRISRPLVHFPASVTFNMSQLDTMSNGLMNLSSEVLIYYHGSLVQEGGAINIHGPLNMPYYYVGPYRGDYLGGAFY